MDDGKNYALSGAKIYYQAQNRNEQQINTLIIRK